MKYAHVLFIDIVGYSKLSINEQNAAVDELTRIVRAIISQYFTRWIVPREKPRPNPFEHSIRARLFFVTDARYY